MRLVGQDEFESWSELFQGYAEFYRWPTSPAHQRQIWGWIHDDRTIEALVAVPVDASGSEIGAPKGLPHLRSWLRPLRGVTCGYLDDLYVTPSARGSGAVDPLFAEINRIAAARKWAIVRWTTAEDNHRAQRVYDRVATRTTWVTYDMSPR